MPLMHRRGPGDHGISELAFTLSKAPAEHYGQALSHRTGWLTDAVLYPARHCVWLNWPSRGLLHDFYEASLATCDAIFPGHGELLKHATDVHHFQPETINLSFESEQGE